MATSSQPNEEVTHPRSIDWMDILKVVAMPLVITVVGLIINSSLTERQSIQNDLRLYADMMARREQADSDLRKAYEEYHPRLPDFIAEAIQVFANKELE